VNLQPQSPGALNLTACCSAGAERVAVRSSANSEDLEKVSGAGLHDSVLGVDIKAHANKELQ
jgi:phosphoenolpyruvate synthase/pyruvate phosphate dikinase